jgi:hypothetical protein
MDFNAFIDAVTDVIADKVAERLKDSGQSWPNIEIPNLETKGIPVEELIEAAEQEEREDRAEPVQVKISDKDGDARRVALGREDVRTLRKKFATVEGVDASTYATWKKPDLVNKIVDFEQLVGRTIDDELDRLSDIPDDTDLSEPEAEDDDETVELTRESMLELDLPKLREIAADQGVTADLAGLDVEAVVAVIYGDDVPEADESDEDEGYTADEVRAMSLAELKRLAAEVNEQGGDIDVERGVDREVLAEAIIDLIC